MAKRYYTFAVNLQSLPCFSLCVNVCVNKDRFYVLTVGVGVRGEEDLERQEGGRNFCQREYGEWMVVY